MAPITPAVATLLSKIVLDKFHADFSTQQEERIIDAAIAPIKKLGEVIWQRCFQDKLNTNELLAQAENGDKQAINCLRIYLNTALDNPELKAEVAAIVQEIQQTIVQFDDASTMTQTNDSGTNYPTKMRLDNTNYFSGKHHH